MSYSDKTIEAVADECGEFRSAYYTDDGVISAVLSALEATPEQKALRSAVPNPDAANDLSIHVNPSAEAWAAYFAKVYPGCNVPQDVMFGWFANAMMAMHDFLKSGGPINGDHAQFLLDQDAARQEGG